MATVVTDAATDLLSGIGAPPTDDDDDDDDDSTSVDDLTTPASPSAFDTSYLASSANLDIEGAYDPVAGDKQVLPRVAYTITYQMIWNPDQDRWEPDEGFRTGGHARLFDDGGRTYPANTTNIDVEYTQANATGPFDVADGDNTVEIPDDGPYQIHAGLTVTNAVDEGDLDLFIKRNADFIFEDGSHDPAGIQTAAAPGGAVECVEGDIISCEVNNNISADLSGFGNENTCYLTVGRI